MSNVGGGCNPKAVPRLCTPQASTGSLGGRGSRTGRQTAVPWVRDPCSGATPRLLGELGRGAGGLRPRTLRPAGWPSPLPIGSKPEPGPLGLAAPLGTLSHFLPLHFSWWRSLRYGLHCPLLPTPLPLAQQSSTPTHQVPHQKGRTGWQKVAPSCSPLQIKKKKLKHLSYPPSSILHFDQRPTWTRILLNYVSNIKHKIKLS